MAIKGIKLNYEPFKGDCVDPVAKVVINEALTFAIEETDRRLQNAGRIFRGVEIEGFPALQSIQGLADSILSAPTCKRELTPTEKEYVRAIAEKSSKGKKKQVRSPKVPPRAPDLTAEVWNTLPVADRETLVAAAEIDIKAGIAAGSLKTEEMAKLQSTWKALAPPRGRPAAPPVEPRELKTRIIPMKMRSKEDPKKLVTVGYGRLNPDSGEIEQRITIEEGNALLGSGNADLVV